MSTASLHALAKAAKNASRQLLTASTKEKNAVLFGISEQLKERKADLIIANEKDIHSAHHKKLDAAMIERLRLDEARILDMAHACVQIAELADPIGEIEDMRYQQSGIQVGKMRVPLGVIGIIYESRPNVTIDAAALCIKSGNAVILRGGSEAIHTNVALAECIKAALRASSIGQDCVQLLTNTDRALVSELIQMSEYVDVIIPRGGKGLIERISRDATIPVIKHLDGICHVYIDAFAERTKALEIAINAKTHRYGVCNAMETLLVHADKAGEILPELCQRYIEMGVQLRGCANTRHCLESHADSISIASATEQDWQTEYLAPILSIKVVANFEEALEHIARYSSGHTEAIVTENYGLAMRFIRQVDSSSVMINASTRFADGGEYGLGAEMGISTDKLHVRGPVGLLGLTSQKYVVFGNGDIRQ